MENEPGIGGNRPLRVGFNDSPPYSMIDANGTPHGFAVDVIREAARRKSIRLELVAFHEGPDRPLTTGKVDIWPLVTDLPERRGKIFFSAPWMRTRYVLLTPLGSPVRDARSAEGRRISHSDTKLNSSLARATFPRSRLVPDPPDNDLKAICGGQADAAFIETKDMLALMLQRPKDCKAMNFDLAPVGGLVHEMGIGASAVGRDQATVLRAAINDMAQDQTLDRYYRKWLHDTDDETAVVNELIGVRRRDALLRWASGSLTVALGLLLGLVWRQRAAGRAIRAATDFASAALDTTGGLVLITDRQGAIVRFNRACERVTGKTCSEVKGKKTWDLFVPADEVSSVQAIYAGLAEGQKHVSNEYHWKTPEGNRLYSWSHSVLTNASGKVEYIVHAGIDISHREAAEKRLIQEATRDPLTNLLNRRGLKRDLDEAIARAKGGERLHLGLADLDWFKEINDTYGHSAGDEVLVCFANLLTEAVGSAGVAARLGGDEFCFVISGADIPFSTGRLRQRLHEREFRSADGRTFRVGVSFGVAEWGEGMCDASDLFEAADHVLYEAKSSSRSRPLAVA